jgi:glycosyltransferase involved in cell wall biosynthesis
MTKPLRIAIDARAATSCIGGGSTFALSLVRALSKLRDGDEKYYYFVNAGQAENLRREVADPIEVIEIGRDRQSRLKSTLRNFSIGVKALRRLMRSAEGVTGVPSSEIARSDGTLETAKIDVVHFTAQYAFLTDIPTIYHPHDLQHRHLPEFFSLEEQRSRDYLYSTFCERASSVSVVSKWSKQDIINAYGIADSKIQIVHFAPDSVHGQISLHSAEASLDCKYHLMKRFLLYPARTWPHKNHLRLLQALKYLRDEHGLAVPLVCTGGQTEFFEKIEGEVIQLGLQEQVLFVGFVGFDELEALYKRSYGVIIPTLFEAGSFPLWEAFLNERPVACSNVTSLPEQAGDAAIIFDPYRIDRIGEAIRMLWENSALRLELVNKGRINVSRFNWDKTARTFRALYRKLGGRTLSEEDTQLLEAPPLM